MQDLTPNAPARALARQEQPTGLRTSRPMTKQAALIALQRNRGELDAAALAKLLAATKA